MGREDGQQPLLGSNSVREFESLQERIAAAVYLSLAVNVGLALVKGFAFFVSGSMSVLASLVDSIVDLVSQALIAWADYQIGHGEDPKFPAGKARLESLSVMGCAYIMTVGALEVVSESAQQLHNGFSKGELPELKVDLPTLLVLIAATVSKAGLWAYCFALRRYSGAALALAEDHINDVVSNLGAIVTAAVASRYRERLWWSDPLGGILISLYIVIRWCMITKRQVDKVVGISAPSEFLGMVEELAALHDPRCSVGFLRAFHAGQRLHVDVELVVPQGMTVAEAAGIVEGLKCKIEALPEVDCAAVFVVHMASGIFLPCRAPGIAPGVRTKAHTTETELDELLEGLSGSPRLAALDAASPRAGVAAARAGRWGLGPAEWGGAHAPPTAAVDGGGVEQGQAQLGGGQELRRAASSSTLAQLQRGARGARGAATDTAGLARQLAWSRSLRDAPSRVLASAALETPDTAAMLLSRCARSSGEQTASPTSPR